MYALNGVFVTPNLKEGSTRQWTKIIQKTSLSFVLSTICIDREVNSPEITLVKAKEVKMGDSVKAKEFSIESLHTCCCEEVLEVLDLRTPNLQKAAIWEKRQGSRH